MRRGQTEFLALDRLFLSNIGLANLLTLFPAGPCIFGGGSLLPCPRAVQHDRLQANKLISVGLSIQSTHGARDRVPPPPHCLLVETGGGHRGSRIAARGRDFGHIYREAGPLS